MQSSRKKRHCSLKDGKPSSKLAHITISAPRCVLRGNRPRKETIIILMTTTLALTRHPLCIPDSSVVCAYIQQRKPTSPQLCFSRNKPERTYTLNRTNTCFPSRSHRITTLQQFLHIRSVCLPVPLCEAKKIPVHFHTQKNDC